MDKVWIVTTKLAEGLDTFVEGVFNSYKLAHMAAEDIWRSYTPEDDEGYLSKDGEAGNEDCCKMTICYTHKKTAEDWLFMTIKIEPYYVWH